MTSARPEALRPHRCPPHRLRPRSAEALVHPRSLDGQLDPVRPRLIPGRPPLDALSGIQLHPVRAAHHTEAKRPVAVGMGSRRTRRIAGSAVAAAGVPAPREIPGDAMRVPLVSASFCPPPRAISNPAATRAGRAVAARETGGADSSARGAPLRESSAWPFACSPHPTSGQTPCARANSGRGNPMRFGASERSLDAQLVRAEVPRRIEVGARGCIHCGRLSAGRTTPVSRTRIGW
jgi:hypothetical protein